MPEKDKIAENVQEENSALQNQELSDF